MTFSFSFFKSFRAGSGSQARTGAARTRAAARYARTHRARIAALFGRGRTPQTAVCAAVIAVLGLVWMPGTALADYEQVPEHFGEAEEAAPANLENSLGIAVNESGEGGVPAGSFYVVGRNHRVKRFTPGKEGEAPQFREAWGWGIGEGGPSSGYVRCGPAYRELEEEGEPLPPNTYPACKPNNSNAPFGGEEIGHFEALAAVAVDQATGNVYVRNPSFAGTQRKHHLIEVFTATGEPVGEGFGDAGFESFTEPESIEEGPEKLHLSSEAKGAIAVDEAGTVYLNDRDYVGVEPAQARIMSFEPCSPGEYDNYCYTGQENDIVTGSTLLSRIALIGADRLAVSVERRSAARVPAGRRGTGAAVLAGDLAAESDGGEPG